MLFSAVAGVWTWGGVGVTVGGPLLRGARKEAPSIRTHRHFICDVHNAT